MPIKTIHLSNDIWSFNYNDDIYREIIPTLVLIQIPRALSNVKNINKNDLLSLFHSNLSFCGYICRTSKNFPTTELLIQTVLIIIWQIWEIEPYVRFTIIAWACVSVPPEYLQNLRLVALWPCQMCHQDQYGPFTRYAKLRVAHAPVMPGMFPRQRGWAIPTCITARAPGTCCDACRDRLPAVSFEVGAAQNVPGIPGACAIRNFAYLVRSPPMSMYIILLPTDYNLT